MRSYPYDSFDLSCKSPFGAVKFDSPVCFALTLSDFTLPYKCELLLYRADEFNSPIRYEMAIDFSYVGSNRYSCKIELPHVAQLYFYCFEITTEDGTTHIKRVDSHNGDYDENGSLWQLTVYDPSFVTPSSLSRGIIYQIFPDRFCNSGTPKTGVPEDRTVHSNWSEMPEWRPNSHGEITNSDYFGGDLLGVAEKLPYLSELGVSLIYLNPIFEAHSNHRYNVADYFTVDPLLGTNEDFKTLCEKAKEHGIGIVLDGVFSHTGSDSVYFNKNRRYGDGGAYNDPNSRYRQWYKFKKYPTEYQSWWNFITLPELVEETPDFLDFICGEQGVIRYWMGLGASGFRLDVADELPDVILDRIREAVKAANPDGILIGEVWEDASNKVAYSQRRHYLLGSQLDSVMNYPFMNAVLRFVRYGDSNALYHGILTILENYPYPSVRLLFNSLSTHDTIRAITHLVGEEFTGGDRNWQFARHELTPQQYTKGCSLLLIAYTLMYFLPGRPCLYYGDEVGVHGWRDPFNRTTFPWKDGSQELLAAFRLLGQIYCKNEFLYEAEYLPITSTGEVFCYTRVAENGSRLIVAVNRSDRRHADLHAITPVIETTENGAPPPVEIHVITGSFHNGVLAPLSAVVAVERAGGEQHSGESI